MDFLCYLKRSLNGGGRSHQLRYDVDGDREDDSAVVLGRDAVERLKIAQLKHKWSLQSSTAVQVVAGEFW